MTRFVSSTWIICKKDLRVWARWRLLIIATLLVPFSYLLVEFLNAAAVGENPVAVVNEDAGPRGEEIVEAIKRAEVFRLSVVTSSEAESLYQQLLVAAIVTIPPTFSQKYEAGERDPIEVEVRNYNLDLANDIRRAVPDAITTFYQEQGANSPIGITIAESDLLAADVQLFQYSVLPTIILLCTVNGIITSGLAASLEFEKKTIKELLLYPGGPLAIILGKVLAGFLTTTLLGSLVLSVGALLGWTTPHGLFWLSALLIIALASLFSSGMGIAIGSFFQRQQPVVFASTVISVNLFALSGGVGVIFFEPELLQQIALGDPLFYAIHTLQLSVFYSSFDRLGRDAAVLFAFSLVSICLGVLAMRRKIQA